MPNNSTPNNSTASNSERLGDIKLTVGGIECNQWDDISIDSDIAIAADGWSFAWLDIDVASLPNTVKSGAVCEISIESATIKDTILVGVIDKIQQTVSRGQSAVVISGRDLAGQLIDTSAPIKQGQNMTLEEIIRQFVMGQDLGSLPWRVITDQNYLKAKTGVEDGESVWDAINKAALASGQYVWMSPEGAICIGNPFNVDQPATPLIFTLNKNGKSYDVINISYSEDLSNAYSIVEVIGQDAKGNNFRGTATDDRATITRRKILNVGDAENQAEAAQYAQKAIRDSWLDAYECNLTVLGWGHANQVYRTGWKVRIDSDVMPRAAGDWVIFGRTIKLTRHEGEITELRLRKYAEWMQPIAHVSLVKDSKAKAKAKTKAKRVTKQTTVKSRTQ